MTEQQDAQILEDLHALSDAQQEHDDRIQEAAIAVVEAARWVCEIGVNEVPSLRDLRAAIDRFDVLVGTRPGPRT